MIWLYSIGSALGVSLISFIGVLALRLTEQKLAPFLLVLVGFSTGALFGDVFIHLLPETIEMYGFSLQISLTILSGIIVFFVLEKFIHWHHCHFQHEDHRIPSLAFMNMAADGLHNFIDGLVIGGSYLVSLPVGIATTIAVILHEIPQELGDYGVLIHSGLSRRKVLFWNFLSALMALAGTVLVVALGTHSESLLGLLIPFTIGGFIYIAGSDLIPELHKQTNPLHSVLQLMSLLLGIGVMMLLLLMD